MTRRLYLWIVALIAVPVLLGAGSAVVSSDAPPAKSEAPPVETVVLETPLPETHIIRTRWNPAGAGRADAYLTEGDLGALVYNATECWDESATVVFYEENFQFLRNGDESACAFSEPSWNESDSSRAAPMTVPTPDRERALTFRVLDTDVSVRADGAQLLETMVGLTRSYPRARGEPTLAYLLRVAGDDTPGTGPNPETLPVERLA